MTRLSFNSPARRQRRCVAPIFATAAVWTTCFLIGLATASALIEWSSREGQIGRSCAPLFTGEGLTK